MKWLGDHGGASWSSQGIPLVMAGPGIKQGHVSHFPARLVDLAPTAMRLLGAPYPRADGIVLADAMQSPTASDVNQQRSVAQYLAPMATALRKQAKIDVQGQPPMTPVKPAKTSPKTISVGPGYEWRAGGVRGRSSSDIDGVQSGTRQGAFLSQLSA